MSKKIIKLNSLLFAFFHDTYQTFSVTFLINTKNTSNAKRITLGMTGKLHRICEINKYLYGILEFFLYPEGLKPSWKYPHDNTHVSAKLLTRA